MRSFIDRTGLRRGLALATMTWAAFSATRGFGGEAERYFESQARDLIDYAVRHNWKTVGVLKFRVYEDQARPNDAAGTLNRELADMLEASLKNAAEAMGNQVHIVREATRRADGIRGANHLTPAGRKRLFEWPYPLYTSEEASGVKQSKVDGFFTGVAILSRDLRDWRIQVIGFGKTVEGLDGAAPAKTLPVDHDLKVAKGEVFQTRGLAGAPEAEEPRVVLDIYYDDVLQELKQDERTKEYFVPEPKKGQKVFFELYTEGVNETLSAVVKVNGQNTWYREQLPAELCTKWILEPGAPHSRINGYIKEDDEHFEQFRVSSPSASRAREVDYGDDVGLISVTVFQERATAASPKTEEIPEDDERIEAGAIAEDDEMPKADAIPETDEIPEDLQVTLRQLDRERQKELGFQTRGMIEAGKVRSVDVREVSFKSDPNPILNMVIRYYQAAREGRGTNGG